MDRIQTPIAWLMTDERFGERLMAVIGALPEGTGVVLREAAQPLADDIAKLCAAKGLLLSVARDAALAQRLGAAMVHNPPEGEVPLPFSVSVHNEAEALAAKMRGATLAFVSPVHATRSHPGAQGLGEERAIELANMCGCPGIALGGMDARNFAPLAKRGFVGWAGIDAWLRN